MQADPMCGPPQNREPGLHRGAGAITASRGTRRTHVPAVSYPRPSPAGRCCDRWGADFAEFGYHPSAVRIGIFSDVHANIEAMNAVIDAYKSERIDKYVCIGDVVGYGASPNECCDLIRRTAAYTILGNHDAAVAGRMDYSYYYDAARQALDLHARQLSPENMSWLRNLPYEVREGDITFCHGSPINLEEFEYIFSVEQATRCLDIWEELGLVTFIGHSHLCKSFALTREEVYEVVATKFVIRPEHRYIISVGSVGQPRDYDNRASYTIYDTEERTFEFKRVAYDIDAAAQKIFAADLERNFGNRLFLGV
jgi:diadenosine tetraphosphatase ApaH/serine/threonine PP2A family protein phosphatase